jgi:hypothetical protein
MNERPVALGLTLCDYVIVEEKTKKVPLIGTFTRISATEFPVIPQPFSVFAVLTDGLGDTGIELVVTRLDTGEDIYRYRGTLHFPDKLAELSFHVRLRQCSFPAAGTYQFTLVVDGEWVAQRRLHLHRRGSTP